MDKNKGKKAKPDSSGDSDSSDAGSSYIEIPQPQIKIIPLAQMTESDESENDEDAVEIIESSSSDDEDVVVLEVKPKIKRKIIHITKTVPRVPVKPSVLAGNPQRQRSEQGPVKPSSLAGVNDKPPPQQQKERGPAKQTGVNCLFCYTPVSNYVVNRTRKKILGKTALRLLNHICSHLEIEPIPIVCGRGNNTPKDERLIPQNLPLCTECMVKYYGAMYETFIAYETTLLKLSNQIATVVTKAVGESAKSNRHSVLHVQEGCWADSADADSMITAFEKSMKEVKEHEVMKAVKHFRQQIVDRNPTACGDEPSTAGSQDLPASASSSDACSKPTRGRGTDSECEGNSSVEATSAPKVFRFDDSGGDDRQTELVVESLNPSKPLDTTETEGVGSASAVGSSNSSLLARDKPFNYYTVSNPCPGVVQIIPVVISDRDAKSKSKPVGQDILIHKIRKRRQSKYETEQRLLLNTCKYCSKLLPNQTALTRHLVQVHGMEKPEKCTQCDYRGITKAELKSHMQTHLSESEKSKNYQCHMCEKSYRARRALIEHEKRHGGEKPYSCQICGKRFSSDASAKFCLDKHNGVKPHKCEFCDKTFLRKEVLKMHTRVHTGEKPFKCHICNKSFSQLSPLRAHLRMHARKDPSCDIRKPKKVKK